MAKRSKSRFTDLVKFVPDTEEELQEEQNNEIRTNILDDKYNDSYDEYDEYVPDDAKQEQNEIEYETENETENTSESLENIQYDELDEIYTIENKKEEPNMQRNIPDFIKEDINKAQPTPTVQPKYNQSPSADPVNMKESIILGNTTIKGDVITDVGIQIYGAVIGNIESGGRVQLAGKVEGDISGKSVVITDTSLNGNIHAENDVSIKSGCVIKGDVSGNKIILNGTIEGNIDATGQVDFEVGSIVDGNVSAKSFNIKPGARINGSISTK